MASTFQVFAEDQQGGQTHTYKSAVNDISQHINKGARSCIIKGNGLWQIFTGKDLKGIPNVLKAGTYDTPASMGMLRSGAFSAKLEL